MTGEGQWIHINRISIYRSVNIEYSSARSDCFIHSISSILHNLGVWLARLLDLESLVVVAIHYLIGQRRSRRFYKLADQTGNGGILATTNTDCAGAGISRQRRDADDRSFL